MKKLVFSLALVAGMAFTNAQVKIGNAPTSIGAGQLLELETQGTRSGLRLAQVALTSSTDITTIGIPASAVGTMVYNTGAAGLTTPGIYTWSGSAWDLATAPGAVTVGDVKTGIQTTDHSGWIMLDGRPKTNLTTTQQARATALGIGTNLPNATNAYLSQNGATLGSVSGANTKTIAQNQLPNVRLYSAATGGGAWQNGVSPNTSLVDIANQSGNDYAADLAWSTTEPTGGRTSSLNGDVTQVALDITPRTMSVNTFIYLGN